MKNLDLYLDLAFVVVALILSLGLFGAWIVWLLSTIH